MTDHALLEELLAPLGPVVIRRMFSGAGLFLDGMMFAIVFEDGLYFKTDAESQVAFEAEGMAPFSYARRTGRTIITSLWRAPERLFDEPDEMLAWARRAVKAARRKQQQKRRNPVAPISRKSAGSTARAGRSKPPAATTSKARKSRR